MTGFILFVMTWVIAYNDGHDTGMEYQKYYDRMMREKIINVQVEKGYQLGLRKAELDRKLKMLELGIDFMDDE